MLLPNLALHVSGMPQFRGDDAVVNVGATLNGRYRLDREIGRGGFAKVYLGVDTTLDRRIAIKVLNQEYATEDTFLARFEREAKQVANLEHPNILTAYDYGHDGDAAFLIMPYVAGGTLKDRLHKIGHMSLQEASGYLAQMAAALDYAHTRRIVHRDIKPQNMLLREDGQLLLSDFGIAKVMHETQGSTNSQVIGTIAYMAPEAFQGNVSPQSDVYSLGCVFFELLTGETPFTGPTQQVMYGHMMAPIPSLAARAREQSLPTALQRVIEWTMAKTPEARCSNARAFSIAVQSIVEGKPPATATDPPPAHLAHEASRGAAVGPQQPSGALSEEYYPPTIIPAQPRAVAANDLIQQQNSRPTVALPPNAGLPQTARPMELQPQERRRKRGLAVILSVVGGILGIAILALAVNTMIGGNASATATAPQAQGTALPAQVANLPVATATATATATTTATPPRPAATEFAISLATQTPVPTTPTIAPTPTTVRPTATEYLVFSFATQTPGSGPPTPTPTPLPTPTPVVALTGPTNLKGSGPSNLPGMLIGSGASISSILSPGIHYREVFALELQAGQKVAYRATGSGQIFVFWGSPGTKSVENSASGPTDPRVTRVCGNGEKTCSGPLLAGVPGTFYLVIYAYQPTGVAFDYTLTVTIE